MATKCEIRRIASELTARANMPCPRLWFCPKALMPLAHAAAWPDIRTIQIGPNLLEEPTDRATCIVAHELAHLANGDGAGDLWVFLVTFTVSLVLGHSEIIPIAFLGWILWRDRGDQRGVKENAADAWAATLIGEERWAAFEADNKLRREAALARLDEITDREEGHLDR